MNKTEIPKNPTDWVNKHRRGIKRAASVAVTASVLSFGVVKSSETPATPASENPNQNDHALIIPNPPAEFFRLDANRPIAVAAPRPEARPVSQATPESPLRKKPEKGVNPATIQSLNECLDITKVIRSEYATGRDEAGRLLLTPGDIDGVLRSDNLSPEQEQRLDTLFTAFRELTGITINRKSAISRKTTKPLREAVEEIKGGAGENTVLWYSYVRPETNRVEFVEAEINERANGRCGAQAEEDGSVLVGANSPTVTTELEGTDENGRRYLVIVPIDARCGNPSRGKEYPKDTPTPTSEITNVIITKTPSGTSTMTITSTPTATGTITTTVTETATNTPTSTETSTSISTATVENTPTGTTTTESTTTTTPTGETITTKTVTFTPTPSPTESETPPATQTITTSTSTATGTWTATTTRTLSPPTGTPTPSKTRPVITVTFTPRPTESPMPTATVTPSPTPGELSRLCIVPEKPTDPGTTIRVDDVDPRGIITDADLAIWKDIRGIKAFCVTWFEIMKQRGVSEENLLKARVIEVWSRDVNGEVRLALRIPITPSFFFQYQEREIDFNDPKLPTLTPIP